jgi:hypothetical protein
MNIIEQVEKRCSPFPDDVYVTIVNEHSILTGLGTRPQRQVIGSLYQKELPIRIYHSGDQSVKDFGKPKY